MPSRARIFARAEGRFAKLLLMPSYFAKLLEAIFLVLPKLYGCQVEIANSWRCSKHVCFAEKTSWNTVPTDLLREKNIVPAEKTSWKIRIRRQTNRTYATPAGNTRCYTQKLYKLYLNKALSPLFLHGVGLGQTHVRALVCSRRRTAWSSTYTRPICLGLFGL